jgi:hypothetical protein
MTDAPAGVHRRAWERGGVAAGGARAVRRIGVLMPYDENEPLVKPRLSAFTQALADLGWIGNVRMVLRWDGDDTNRMRALAQELIGLQPDIIFADSTVALQRETRTIPIVFLGGSTRCPPRGKIWPCTCLHMLARALHAHCTAVRF